MSRTYLSGDNSRGTQVTAAGGKHAHFRGWNAGVEVQYISLGKDSRDGFDVYMTSGSSGSSGRVRLGSVYDTADGPVWEAAADAMSADAMGSSGGSS